MKKLLVTGSSGLIGSEVCMYFSNLGWQIHGIDNNQRAIFFGPQGDTRWNQNRLATQLGISFIHHELDIRNREGILELIRKYKPGCYCAYYRATFHYRANVIPFDDFDTML